MKHLDPIVTFYLLVPEVRGVDAGIFFGDLVYDYYGESVDAWIGEMLFNAHSIRTGNLLRRSYVPT